ncbi:MAG: diaminopimelate epimerase [Deltaproteobacteria bacterium]
MKTNSFIKSHGLGNEYVILDEANIDFALTTRAVRRICNVHHGIGSDGILLRVPASRADFAVRIFNPDGSEAEKSGNGLRIFCKYLYDYGYARNRFTVETSGGVVTAEIIEETQGKAGLIRVDMGRATFISREIPTSFPEEEALGIELTIADRVFQVNCVSVGNPHCVILTDELDLNEILQYGSLIENNSSFPNRINVQFARVISPGEVEILIWERGAGYTLASGSSSCAVASVLRKLGLVDRCVTIHMPGGQLQIEVDDDYNIRMTGPVRQIAEGVLSAELIEDLESQ